MSDIVGARIQLSYFDQNESFAKVLPVVGEITARFETHEVGDWYRLDLDEPIKYESRAYSYLLIRSRYAERIGGPEGTSVFIVLDPAGRLKEGGRVDIAGFDHVAWGWASVPNAA
jgi:hypothetical protein